MNEAQGLRKGAWDAQKHLLRMREDGPRLTLASSGFTPNLEGRVCHVRGRASMYQIVPFAPRFCVFLPRCPCPSPPPHALTSPPPRPPWQQPRPTGRGPPMPITFRKHSSPHRRRNGDRRSKNARRRIYVRTTCLIPGPGRRLHERIGGRPVRAGDTTLCRLCRLMGESAAFSCSGSGLGSGSGWVGCGLRPGEVLLSTFATTMAGGLGSDGCVSYP